MALDYRDLVAMNICLLMDIAATILCRESGEGSVPTYEQVKKQLHKQLDATIKAYGLDFASTFCAELGEISDSEHDAWTIKLSFNQSCVYAGGRPAFWLEGAYVPPKLRRKGVFTSIMRALTCYRHVKDVSFVPTSEEICQWLMKHGVEEASMGMCSSVGHDIFA